MLNFPGFFQWLMLVVSLMGHSYWIINTEIPPLKLKKNPLELFKSKVKLSTATQYSMQLLAFPCQESLSWPCCTSLMWKGWLLPPEIQILYYLTPKYISLFFGREGDQGRHYEYRSLEWLRICLELWRSSVLPGVSGISVLGQSGTTSLLQCFNGGFEG